jgi:DNA helicase II / ATP-dependent DNA helicase PcrA
MIHEYTTRSPYERVLSFLSTRVEVPWYTGTPMVKSTPTFDTLYGKLNTRQKEAVDAIEGPVMVIAGPGTGKTQILTLRIANILKHTDVPADAILALTFTNAAAANMRKRLVSVIGSDAYRVSIYTFHSFANHLIDTHPEWFGFVAGRTNCSEVERIDIIRSLIDAGRFELIKPMGEPYHNVVDIMSGISHLKREGITPGSFATWVDNERSALMAQEDLYHTKGVHVGKMKGEYVKRLRSLDKNGELAIVYRQYQEALAVRHRYDFDDSLLLLIEALERHEDFLRELQEDYQYFLVDEHQDTNGAQNRILELLATYFDRPNLFVVGDEKQAIFRFQGASLTNFLYFEKKFKDVRRITLDTNYRSHQGVLDAAHALILQSSEGIHAPLTAHHTPPAEHDARIKVYTFNADDEELLFLAESIQAKLADGVPAHEIAVLYRSNRDVEAIGDYFERLGIPFLIESGHGVLDDPDIRKLNLLLRSLDDLTNDDILASVLFIGFLEVPVPDVYALIREARSSKRSLFEVLVSPGEALLSDPAAVQRVCGLLIGWKRAAENESFLQVFEQVVRESGLLVYLQQSTFHVEKFDKLVRLFDEMKAHVRRTPFFTVRDYRTFLTILEEHNVTLDAQSRQVPQAVRLMTAHRAKGLEFDYVFIVHTYDGHWGGRTKHKYFLLPYRSGTAALEANDLDDERRLFYVAITRARKDVYISYPARAPDGRDRVPTQFIEEIHEGLRTMVHGDSLGYANKRPPLFVERKGRAGVERYGGFIQSAFAERGLSATALNNYLTCPWKWFYESFFHTHFVPSIHQIKGTAVHGALEAYFNARNADPHTPYEVLHDQFVTRVHDADFDELLKERVIRETGAALKGWHTTWAPTWKPYSKNELSIGGILIDDTIRLTGKLDKVEYLDDPRQGGSHEVSVVDYKTGHPKSRNDIEGTTKTAQRKPGAGGYKRQLVFYKILLDRYADGMFRMQEGVLDFIEPTDSGTYKREAFAIEAKDADALLDTIRRVADEIQRVSFWDTRCEDAECSACALRDLLE